MPRADHDRPIFVLADLSDPLRRMRLGVRRVTTMSTMIVLGLAFASTGCETTPAARAPLNYTEDSKRAYDEAMVRFNAHDWMEAQALMREVKRKFSYSKYARLAELRIADADFEQEKYSEAIRGYRQFVHDHRSDVEEVGYARARIAEAQYKQISESFLLPSADERDQAVILDAYKELKGYVHDYPQGKDSARIRELLADVTARLMRHELYVARFYLQRDNFQAAVLRIQYAMRNFAGGGVSSRSVGPNGGPPLGGAGPVKSKASSSKSSGAQSASSPVDSGLEAEALLLLGEVYLKMHKFAEARETFTAIVADYPSSPLVVQANNFLSYMRERGV